MEMNRIDTVLLWIAVAILMISVPFGLFPWAFLGTVGVAAIQAGLHGFRTTGYPIWGHTTLTGKSARTLGSLAIAIGIIWELVLISFLIKGFDLFR